VSFALVPESFRDITQAVMPIDDRCCLSGFDEILQNSQVRSLCFTTNTRIRWRTNGDSRSALI
jgi:hypothetical protein